MNRLSLNNGSALFIVLIVLLLITTLFSAVILYGSYHRRLALQDIQDSQAYYLAESGIEYALARLNDEPGFEQTFTENISPTGRIEVALKPFGAYLLCESRGIAGKRNKIIRCLIGAVPDQMFTHALNLGGQDYPLTLAGHTTIIGDVLVSPSGVLPGRYKGQRFGSDKLVYGEIIKSPTDRMPLYDDTIITEFIDGLSGIDIMSARRFDKTTVIDDNAINLIEQDSLLKFDANLAINLVDKKLDLTNKYLKVGGNLHITGDSRIYGYGIIEVEGETLLDGDCQVKDMVIVVKREATIAGNAVYAGQLLGNADIEVQGNAALSQSATLINIGELTDEPRCIYLNTAESSSGYIICDLLTAGVNQPGRQRMLKAIDLSDSADFTGVIFNSGYSKISGELTGNISSGSFYIYDAPTVYINWLVDAMLESSAEIKVVPAVFAGVNGYGKIGGL
jgi:hypothetical protein